MATPVLTPKLAPSVLKAAWPGSPSPTRGPEVRVWQRGLCGTSTPFGKSPGPPRAPRIPGHCLLGTSLYHQWGINRVCPGGSRSSARVAAAPSSTVSSGGAQQHPRLPHTLGSRVSPPSPSLGPQAGGRPEPADQTPPGPRGGDGPQANFQAVYSLLRRVCGPRAPEPWRCWGSVPSSSSQGCTLRPASSSRVSPRTRPSAPWPTTAGLPTQKSWP